MEQGIRIRRTTLIIVGLMTFLAGLGLARITPSFEPMYAVISLIIFAVVVRRRTMAAAIAMVAIGLSFGIWRGSVYMDKIAVYDELYGQKVIITGIAEDDSVYDGPQLSFDISRLYMGEGSGSPLVGKIGVRGFGEPMVYKGDRVTVEGRMYKTRGSRQGGMSYAQISIVSSSSSLVDSIKRRFQAGIYSALPEPTASFGLGLLIGQRNTLPESVNDQLAAVGLTHVVAVSGYNLTIIVRAVRRLLKKLSKYQQTIISMLLIGTFLLFTGFSPSIVRAAVVSALSIIAWYYGRSFRPLLIILLAAALTAGWHPLYIWSDIGWYLSFLAFFGVLIVAPLTLKRLYKKKNQPHPLMMIVYESLAAQLMTLPLIMYIFGQISVVAILANLLVVPLVPFAMAFSLVAGIAGAILPGFSGWFALPARYLMTYMLDIVTILSRVPGALAEMGLKIWQLITLYTALGWIMLIIWRGSRTKNGIITDNDGIKT